MLGNIIKVATIIAQVLWVGAVLIGIGLWAEGAGEQECAQKGKALGAEVKFYHDRCYVKGYSDGR